MAGTSCSSRFRSLALRSPATSREVASEENSKLLLCSLERLSALRLKILSGTICIEAKNRHRPAILRVGTSLRTTRRATERHRDLPRVFLGKDPFFEVTGFSRPPSVGNVSRPPLWILPHVSHSLPHSLLLPPAGLAASRPDTVQRIYRRSPKESFRISCDTL